MSDLHFWLSDFVPVSGRNWIKLRAYDAFSNGRPCYFINQFIHIVYKEIVKQMFINKI